MTSSVTSAARKRVIAPETVPSKKGRPLPSDSTPDYPFPSLPTEEEEVPPTLEAPTPQSPVSHPPDTQLPLAAEEIENTEDLTYATKEVQVSVKKGDQVYETPENVRTTPEWLMKNLSSIKFDTYKSTQKDKAMRYITIPTGKGSEVTKGVHLIFEDRLTSGEKPPLAYNPPGKYDSHAFCGYVKLSQTEYHFFRPEGPFVTHLLKLMINDPVGVLGPDDPWTLEIQTDIAQDAVDLQEVLDDEKEAMQMPFKSKEDRLIREKKFAARKVKFLQHHRCLDSMRKKLRQPNQVREGDIKDPETGERWDPSWSVKTKNTSKELKPDGSGEKYPPYPTGTIYKRVGGKAELLYHHDHTLPPFKSKWNTKQAQVDAHIKRLGIWDEMHKAVAAQHPDGRKVGELIKPRSTLTWIITVLGISRMAGTLDVSLYISQIIITKDPLGGYGRPIGQPPPCYYIDEVTPEEIHTKEEEHETPMEGEGEGEEEEHQHEEEETQGY